MINGLKIILCYDSDCNARIQTVPTTTFDTVTIGKNYPIPITNDPTVNHDHFKLFKTPSGEWHVKDESQYGTYIRIPKNTPNKIPYGLFIVCGKTWIDTTNPKSIVIINDKFQILKQFTPEWNVDYTIGKNGNESFVIDDNSLSGNHAKLNFKFDGVEVTDWKNGEGSTNGTFISLREMPIKEEMILRIGLETFCKIEPIFTSQYVPSFHPSVPIGTGLQGKTVKFGENAPTTEPMNQPSNVYNSPPSHMMGQTYQGEQHSSNQTLPNTLPLLTPGAARPQIIQSPTKPSNEIPTNKWGGK